MDYRNLIADKQVWMNKHYDVGRPSGIRRTILHHNSSNLTTETCWNVWQTRRASAHYQVEIDGITGQLVHDGDRAWHAGNANVDSIGIEHANNQRGPWTISEETLEAGAHLVGALHRYYGLGRPEWGVNVFGHNDFMATDCPGEIGRAQNAKYMERAQYWYDNPEGETPEESEEDEMYPKLINDPSTGTVYMMAADQILVPLGHPYVLQYWEGQGHPVESPTPEQFAGLMDTSNRMSWKLADVKSAAERNTEAILAAINKLASVGSGGVGNAPTTFKITGEAVAE